MKIIYPRTIVLLLLFPMLFIVGLIISFVIFKYINLIFIVSFSSISYIHGVYSYSITIKGNQIFAKDTIFQLKKNSIRIEDIKEIRTEKIRSGESYLKLISEIDRVSIYRTYFKKNQLLKLRKIIREYNQDVL